MTTTSTEPTVRPIEVGTRVIATGFDGVHVYAGPSDSDGEQIAFGYSYGDGMPRIFTSADRVAPADIEVPEKDPRVTVTKRTTREARAAGYFGDGSWSYTVPCSGRTLWAKTKKAALANGARRLAIADWHAAA